jgi:transcriptional regulator with XRE-family HTH domain
MERTKAPSGRFAAALKQARLKKRWKQEDLADALHVKPRTIVSWETGTRLPSTGMVFLLATLLTNDHIRLAELLQHDLFLSYLIDDLHDQEQVYHDQAFHTLVEQRIEQLMQNPFVEVRPGQESAMHPFSLEEQHEMKPTREASSPSQEGMLQHLFTLIERLREHPELIAVVNDFLHEVSDTAR